jgi:hypothetical protein
VRERALLAEMGAVEIQARAAAALHPDTAIPGAAATTVIYAAHLGIAVAYWSPLIRTPLSGLAQQRKPLPRVGALCPDQISEGACRRSNCA